MGNQGLTCLVGERDDRNIARQPGKHERGRSCCPRPTLDYRAFAV